MGLTFCRIFQKPVRYLSSSAISLIYRGISNACYFIIIPGRKDLLNFFQRDSQVAAGCDDIQLVHIPAGKIAVMLFRVNMIRRDKTGPDIKMQSIFRDTGYPADLSDLISLLH